MATQGNEGTSCPLKCSGISSLVHYVGTGLLPNALKGPKFLLPLLLLLQLAFCGQMIFKSEAILFPGGEGHDWWVLPSQRVCTESRGVLPTTWQCLAMVVPQA